MTELVRDHVVIPADPEAIWRILEDPVALARVLPGAESIVQAGPSLFHGVLATKIQFLTVRAEVEASYHDADRPRHLRLELVGRPRGLAGAFNVSIPFDLAPADGGTNGGSATEVSYAVDLAVSGRLATFGAPLLRETLRRQIALLIANLERELADERTDTPT